MDTYSRSFQQPFGHTINKQADERNTLRQGLGVWGRRSGGQTESLVQFLIKLCIRIIRFMESPEVTLSG